MRPEFPEPILLFAVMLASLAAFASTPSVRQAVGHTPPAALISFVNRIGIDTAAAEPSSMPED